MTPHELRIERIHNTWRRASSAAKTALARWKAAVDAGACPAECKKLGRRAQGLCKRAHNLAMAEVRAVFQGTHPKPQAD